MDPELAIADHPGWVCLLLIVEILLLVIGCGCACKVWPVDIEERKRSDFFLVEGENLINFIPVIEDRGDRTWLK